MKINKTFQRKYKPYGKGGWFYESQRHSLAAKGIPTIRQRGLDYLSNPDVFKGTQTLRAAAVIADAKPLIMKSVVGASTPTFSSSFAATPLIATTKSVVPAASKISTVASGLSVVVPKMPEVTMDPSGTSASYGYTYEPPEAPAPSKIHVPSPIPGKLWRGAKTVGREAAKSLSAGMGIYGFAPMKQRYRIVRNESIGVRGQPYPTARILAGLNAKGKFKQGDDVIFFDNMVGESFTGFVVGQPVGRKKEYVIQPTPRESFREPVNFIVSGKDLQPYHKSKII